MTEQDVQYHIDALSQYKEVKRLNKYNIIHLYDTGKCCGPDNSGYWDSRHFTAWGFNTETMTKINLGIHDAISFSEGVKPFNVRIYVDGSTLIKFGHMVTDDGEQDLTLTSYIGSNPDLRPISPSSVILFTS